MPAEQPDHTSGGAGMMLVPSEATAKAPADRFTGDVWVDTITGGASAGSARLASVRFSPGAHTAWHRHSYGQTLHVTTGRGVVVTQDGHTIAMRPGDTVYTPPLVWHWHGATPQCFMSHLALADSGTDPDVADVEWGEHVSDADYRAATSRANQSEQSTQ